MHKPGKHKDIVEEAKIADEVDNTDVDLCCWDGVL